MKVELELREMKLNQNLKKMMALRKLNLKALSKEVDVPPSTIHGWLNGAAPKSIVDLKRMADFFSISIDELCFGESEKMIHPYQENVLGFLGNVELVLRQKE